MYVAPGLYRRLPSERARAMYVVRATLVRSEQGTGWGRAGGQHSRVSRQSTNPSTINWQPHLAVALPAASATRLCFFLVFCCLFPVLKVLIGCLVLWLHTAIMPESRSEAERGLLVYITGCWLQAAGEEGRLGRGKRIQEPAQPAQPASLRRVAAQC